MKRFDLGMFSVAGCEPFAGIVREQNVLALSALRVAARDAGTPLTACATLSEFLMDWDHNLAAIKRVLAMESTTNHAGWTSLSALRIHAPLPAPRQILCSGANYRKHVIDLIVDQGGGPATANMSAAERRAYGEKLMDERAATGSPYIFTKLPSSLIGPFDPIVLPARSKQTDWELELAVVISRHARHVRREDALSVVAGYTIINDMTNRDLVFRDDLKAIGTDWLSGKSSPCFSPMGPYLTPAEWVRNPQDLRIELKLNGATMQDESTADMIFDVARLIEYASSAVDLLPGDALLTGSPSGNGTHYNRYLQPGDELTGAISMLGEQRNRCVAEAP